MAVLSQYEMMIVLQCSLLCFTSQNAYKQVTFNTSGVCEAPLVATDNEKSWYDGVEGCGIQCTNPLFTKEQHNKVHIFIAVFASMCLVSTFFTLVSCRGSMLYFLQQVQRKGIHIM